jgi:predicted ester cyclase
MQIIENKELIRRWIEFANAGFIGNFEYFIAPDYVGHLGDTVMDRSELERFEREYQLAFPDTQHSIDDLIAEDDRVVVLP